jgi:cellulose synthase/poly-beta-1,6-N-acetylglucosamine synthase-like glycosyltransferase
MNTIEISFWVAVGFIAYIYFGYPATIFLISKLRHRRVRKGHQEPTLSLLIAAHNEAAHIAKTLENSLNLDYDQNKLQIIVVSDGSTDGTDDIVRGFAGRGVILLRQEPRNGKSAALNVAAARATGEVLLFADANSMYDKAALRHIASNFADPTVGYVTGKLRYRNEDGTMTGDGCSLYMRYENFIRSCESAAGSLVGVNGGIDAVRRSLYQEMQPDDLPDLVLPLRVVESGFRVVYEPEALLTEDANTNTRDEYRMRVRVSLRALWTLADMSHMMSVRRHGFYAIQLWSHKALRYLAFGFMCSAFFTAALLSGRSPFYRLMYEAQLMFAVVALLGLLAEQRGWKTRALAVPYYFALVNAASFQACFKYLRRQRHRLWSPRLG